MKKQSGPSEHFHAVILAGGRGTRFWPRSRRLSPKQLLPVVGDRSLLRQTFERISELAPPQRVWALTSADLTPAVRKELPEVPAEQVIAEPAQRNTAPAIGLAARLALQRDPEAILGVFPADHLVAKPARFLAVLRSAIRTASKRKLVVIGMEPTRPETGFGYLEFPHAVAPGARKSYPVSRFLEKPGLAKARHLLNQGRYYWNSGVFVWRADVIWKQFQEHLPETATVLEQIDPSSPDHLKATLAEYYAECEDISIDYGVLERIKSNDVIAGYACPNVGWDDVGSWEAVYLLLPKDELGNAHRSPVVLQRASGNLVDAPGKLVALVNVHDLVIVDSPDALLVCPRKDAQKVSSLVKALAMEGVESVL